MYQASAPRSHLRICHLPMAVRSIGRRGGVLICTRETDDAPGIRYAFLITQFTPGAGCQLKPDCFSMTFDSDRAPLAFAGAFCFFDGSLSARIDDREPPPPPPVTDMFLPVRFVSACCTAVFLRYRAYLVTSSLLASDYKDMISHQCTILLPMLTLRENDREVSRAKLNCDCGSSSSVSEPYSSRPIGSGEDCPRVSKDYFTGQGHVDSRPAPAAVSHRPFP